MVSPDYATLLRQNEELRYQLEEARELIDAVRTGAVDALAIQGADGPRIFTLQGADEGYRTLIEQMNEGALLLGADGTILYGNACVASWLHQALEEVIGGDFASFVPSDFQTYWADLLRQGWAEGQAKGELALRTSFGSLRPFALSMNVLTFNETPVLAVILTDLSAQRQIKVIQALVAEQNEVIDRKNEELARQEAARRLVERAAAEATRLLEGIPQIAWTANVAGITTHFNRRWFDYTGEDPAKETSFHWADHQHPADTVAAAQRWTQSLTTGETFEVEFRLRDRDGNYRWMLSRSLPSRNEAGQIIQWIGTCTDIHEHKLALARIDLAQRQLQDNNARLTHANVDLDNFIYTASHDLKAPISNIEGLLHALLTELPEGGGTGEQVPLIMDMMQDSVERFKRTIGLLTDVSQLQKESGQPIGTVDLTQLIKEVQLDLSPQIQEAGAEVQVDVAACATLPFTEKNLRSVIYNLLSNAVKYHSPARVPQVRISCQPAGEFAVLTFQDNGLGLDTANNKLFAMFQRLHDHVDGSGIGLYMVKKIVENAGGRIEVASEVGVGSTFSVFIRQ